MRATYLPLFVLCMALFGCVSMINTVQTINGTDFDETKVAQIRKGVTTADQVVSLFGPPESEEIVSGAQVLWHYDYQVAAHTDQYTNSSDVKQTIGYDKKLDLLMQGDVVVNFAYVKAPVHTEKDAPQ